MKIVIKSATLGTVYLFAHITLTQIEIGILSPDSGDNPNQLVNESEADAVYLEIGDRTAGDEVCYPDDDIQAVMFDGKWRFSHKDGSPY